MLLLALFYRPMAVDSFDPVFLRMVGGHGMRALFVMLVVFNLVRELPGLRHVAVDRPDAAAGGDGTLLDQPAPVS